MQLLWICSSVLLAIAFIGGVVVLIVFAAIMAYVDNEKHVYREPAEPVFKGPSRLEMEMTTARLLRNDKRRPRKRHAQVVVIR